MKINSNFAKFIGFVMIIFQIIEIVLANYEVTAVKAVGVTIPKEDKFLNLDKLKIKRISREEPHKLYGDMVYIQNITDDIEFLGELYIKQGGEYRKTVYKHKDQYCKIIETDTVFQPSIAATFKPQWPAKCPIPAGTYYIDGYLPDPTNIPPVLATGDYIIYAQWFRNGKLLQGIQVYVHFINKKGGLIGLK